MTTILPDDSKLFPIPGMLSDWETNGQVKKIGQSDILGLKVCRSGVFRAVVITPSGSFAQGFRGKIQYPDPYRFSIPGNITNDQIVRVLGIWTKKMKFEVFGLEIDWSGETHFIIEPEAIKSYLNRFSVQWSILPWVIDPLSSKSIVHGTHPHQIFAYEDVKRDIMTRIEHDHNGIVFDAVGEWYLQYSKIPYPSDQAQEVPEEVGAALKKIPELIKEFSPIKNAGAFYAQCGNALKLDPLDFRRFIFPVLRSHALSLLHSEDR